MSLISAFPLRAQQIPSAIFSDPAPDAANPASMQAPDVPSHGALMHAVFYIASGAGSHPTVLLMHGFPGNEQNMDLAYSIRRAGWNVLVPHYRGSWGSEGTFSFAHALEDTQAAVEFLRDPDNVKKYRIDPKEIVMIGHSLGGFVTTYTVSRNPDIAAAAVIAAWNLGESVSRPWTDGYKTFHTASPRLAGTTPDGLVNEAKQHTTDWNYLNWVPGLKDRPILVVEASDANIGNNQALAEALRKAGDAQVTEVHIPADHTFSDHRIALQASVLEWLEKISAGKPK
jgi:pimeloyl-ACP methyl ester carboxylesterase